MDVVIPVLHGHSARTGTLQDAGAGDGAYVGADVTGSAVGMDKGHRQRLA